MLFQRSGGIILHPTSLPGPDGVGDLGPDAYRWVDFLADPAAVSGRFCLSGQPAMATPLTNVFRPLQETHT